MKLESKKSNLKNTTKMIIKMNKDDAKESGHTKEFGNQYLRNSIASIKKGTPKKKVLQQAIRYHNWKEK
jgi:hypothetical protein